LTDKKKYGPQPSKFEEEAEKLKKQYIQKYYSKTYDMLYEAVLVGGKPYFVSQEWDLEGVPFGNLIERIPLPEMADKPTMQLVPPEKEMYLSKPYEFASENELNKYLKLASVITLDGLYQRQKDLVSKYVDASDTHLTMLAADAIVSYFQDRLGQTHYDVFVGDNDTGKTSNLVYLQYEGYRAMLSADITAANIYSFLGFFEEGQGIILEDEADDIHKKLEKMKIYKTGYNSGQKVPRTDITNFGRKTTAWNTYSFKAFTMEELPDVNIAKGFMDRCFAFHCTRGSPQYDIKEVTNPAGDNEFTDLLNELLHHRKLLFAFRLLHYQDPLPNIELSIKNREKQLCKPVLRLFQDSKCQEQIGEALADLIRQKRGLKRDTLEAKILEVIKELMEENKQRNIDQKQEEEIMNKDDGGEQWTFKPWQPNQIPTYTLFERVCTHLDGTYRHPNDKSFNTDQYGYVSHDKIRRICVDKFSAESRRRNSIRYLEFDLNKLEKAKAAYVFPDKVVILEKNVRESGCAHSDADQPVSAGKEDEANGDSREENGPSNEDVLPAKNDENASPEAHQDSKSDIHKSGGD
jgi:hypothetical protein